MTCHQASLMSHQISHGVSGVPGHHAAWRVFSTISADIHHVHDVPLHPSISRGVPACVPPVSHVFCGIQWGVGGCSWDDRGRGEMMWTWCKPSLPCRLRCGLGGYYSCWVLLQQRHTTQGRPKGTTLVMCHLLIRYILSAYIGAKSQRF
jgi:hypothetical protein